SPAPRPPSDGPRPPLDGIRPRQKAIRFHERHPLRLEQGFPPRPAPVRPPPMPAPVSRLYSRLLQLVPRPPSAWLPLPHVPAPASPLGSSRSQFPPLAVVAGAHPPNP